MPPFKYHSRKVQGDMIFHRTIGMLQIALLVFLCFVQPRKAFAYVDPGTGSYVLQVLLAALFGALFAVKIFWTKIKRLLKQLRLLPNRVSKDSDNQ